MVRSVDRVGQWALGSWQALGSSLSTSLWPLLLPLPFLLLPASAMAKDWYVDVQDPNCGTGSGGPNDPFCHIADAIAAASPGDTVIVAPGTYLENVFVDRDLDLVGTQGRDRTAVNAQGSHDRVVRIGDGVVATITGIAFTGGEADLGAGILVGLGAQLTLRDARVHGNRAVSLSGDAKGGGISVRDGGLLHVERSIVDDNSAEVAGGGLCFAATSEGRIVSGEITDNLCERLDTHPEVAGGGVCNEGDLEVIGSIVSRNRCAGLFAYGGGIANSNLLSVRDSLLEENEAFSDDASWGNSAEGGALFNSRLAFLGDSILRSNRTTAILDASGAQVFNAGNVTMSGCEIAFGAGKGGGAQGAGLYSANHSALVDGCTIAKNSASGFGSQDGAAVYGWVTLTNCIVWANTGGTALDGLKLVQYSDVEGGHSGTGNLDVDPRFVNVFQGRLELASDSPCIDHADPAAAPTGTDLGGNPRLLDGDLDRVLRMDMGAHEFGHVHLEIQGTPTWGGSVTLVTTGTPGLRAFLFFGLGAGEIQIPPYGALFLDPTQYWDAFFLTIVPNTQVLAIPPGSGAVDLVVQELALQGKPGNFSNPVFLRIE